MMTSLRRRLATLLAAATFLTGALVAQDATPPAEGAPAAPAEGAAQKTTIRFAAQAGAAIVMRRSIVQEIDQVIEGAPAHTHTEQLIDLLLEVHSIEANGVVTMKATYRRLRQVEKGKYANMEYDSDRGDPGKDLVPVFLNSMKGKTFWFQVAPDGTIANIKGATEIAQAAYIDSELPEVGLLHEMGMNLFNQWNDAAMVRVLAGYFANVPPMPIAPGDKWSKQGDEMQMGVPVKSQSEFSVVSTDASQTILSVTTNFTPIPQQNGATLTGTRTSTLELNTAFGFLTKGTINAKVEGSLGTPMGLLPTKADIAVVIETLPPG